MATIIEKDSSAPATLLILIVIVFLLAGGLGFAYVNGALGERPTIIENNKTIENRTVVLPEAAPAQEHHDQPAPQHPEQPAPAPAR